MKEYDSRSASVSGPTCSADCRELLHAPMTWENALLKLGSHLLFCATCSVLATWLLISNARAQEAQDLAKSVRQYQLQLDDDRIAQRVAAEKKLIELGPQVLDHLSPLTVDTSSETLERLARIRSALETELVKAATQSTRVTLTGRMSLSAAGRLIEQQTGNIIQGLSAYDVEINPSLRNVTFWEAVDEILDQGQLTLDPYGGNENALTVVARPPEQRGRSQSAVYSGIFRIEPIRIQAFQDLRNPHVNGLRLLMEIGWEPRLTPIVIDQPLDRISLVDEQGRQIKLTSKARLSANIQPEIPQVQLDIPLTLPERGAKKIEVMSGEIVALIPGRIESFEFSELETANNLAIRKAGVTVTLAKLSKVSELFAVQIRIRFDEAGNALESHRGWIFRNRAFLKDSKGNELAWLSFETDVQTANELGLTYLFDVEDSLDDMKFIYETPAAIVRIPFRYQLNDIALP